MSAAVMTTGKPEVVYGREAYVPEWTPVRSGADLDVEVTSGGVSLGFRVGDVLPERRWAVTMSGELLPQRDFEDLYCKFVGRVVRQDRIIPVVADNAYYDPRLGHIPLVRDFVDAAFDHMGRHIRIGFDPNKPAQKSAGGEVKQIPVQTAPALRVQLETLAQLKARGVLNDEQFSSEVSRLVTSPNVAEPPAGPPPGFSRVVTPDDAEPAQAEPAAVFTAKCGRECASKAGRAAHERNCDDCQTTPQEAA